MNHEEIKQIKEKLCSDNSLNIAIVTHKNPDGDALGSSLGLKHILESIGHKVSVIVPNDFPLFLKWLPGAKDIIRGDWNKNKAAYFLYNADIIFALDFNVLQRIDMLAKIVESSKSFKILIDHHQHPDNFADITYSDEDMVATSQMIYHFAQMLDLTSKIDSNAADCLLTGIMTDSGAYMFPKTTAQTYRIVADLIERGANSYQIYQRVEMSFNSSRLKLLGVSLSQMTLFEDFASSCILLSQQQLDDNDFRKGDTEGFVNYPLSIKGINCSGFFVESQKEQIIKVSLRSRGNFSVNLMAKEFFNGGGHLNAAGGILHTTDLNIAFETFKNAIEKYKDQIINSFNSVY